MLRQRLLQACFVITAILILTPVLQLLPSLRRRSYEEDGPDIPPQLYRDLALGHNTRVLELRAPVRGEDHIIFLETSCAAKDDEEAGNSGMPELRLSYLHVCAIESAATSNPNKKVYLFYSCPLDANSLKIASDLIHRLFQLPNFHVWHEPLATYFHGTPLQAFYESRQMQRSRYRTSHTCDVLRFLTLWKYGGIYLDLDFIVRRPLDSLGKNFAGAEDARFLASGAMGMTTDGVGKEVIDACVEEIRTNFRGDLWSYNGPGLISRVLHKRCGTELVDKMTAITCEGFTVHPRSVFYAVNHGAWRDFFTEDRSEQVMETVKASHAVHLWNSKSKIVKHEYLSKMMIPESKQPISLLRKQFCPRVYEQIVSANRELSQSSGM